MTATVVYTKQLCWDCRGSCRNCSKEVGNAREARGDFYMLYLMFRGFNDVSRWQRCLTLPELSRGFKVDHRRPKSDPGLEHINVRIIIMHYVSLYRLY